MSHAYLRGDALAIPLPDGSVDTIVTDPPWHFEAREATQFRQDHNHYMREGRARTKAVRAADYALIGDGDMPAAFLEMRRVLADGGHLYAFIPERKLATVAHGLAEAAGLEWFNTIIWVKVRKDGTDIRMGLGHTYRQTYEAILCLSKGRRRPLETRSCPNVMLHPPIGGSVKPAELYRRLVEASTPRGGTVLDPFAGSDPLGAAALDGWDTISLDKFEWCGPGRRE